MTPKPRHMRTFDGLTPTNYGLKWAIMNEKEMSKKFLSKNILRNKEHVRFGYVWAG